MKFIFSPTYYMILIKNLIFQRKKEGIWYHFFTLKQILSDIYQNLLIDLLIKS